MLVRVPSLFKKLTIRLIVCSFLAGSLMAQTTSPTPAGAQPKAAAASTPPPFQYVPIRKAGFFEKLFKKKPTPSPTPAPSPATVAATPKPTPRLKKKKKSATEEPVPSPTATVTPTPSPEAEAEAEAEVNVPSASPDGNRLPDSLPPLSAPAAATVETTPMPPPPVETPPVETSTSEAPVVSTTAQPISREVRDNPLNQPIPLLSETSGSETISVPSPEAEMEKETVDRIQFRKVKAKALADAKLQDLWKKTETAATPEDRYAALKVYYPKLFATMRKIDKNLSLQIDEMEAASRRRLERMEADGLTGPASN